MIRQIISHSPAETKDIARQLALKLAPGTVIALYGGLGAGKTCFIQGLAAALDIHQYVSSPTFTLVNEYSGPKFTIYHLDCYRFGQFDEALQIGLDEYLSSPSITAIEWAERIDNLLPPSTIRIHFQDGQTPEERLITIDQP